MIKTNKKRGFSIMEAVIALAVIVVVTAASLSVVMAAISARVRATNNSEAQDFAYNVLECFKASDDTDFINNVNFAEGVNLELDDPSTVEEDGVVYTVYTYEAENRFSAEIKVNFTTGNFEIHTYDNKGDTIVSFDYDKYVSQGDGT